MDNQRLRDLIRYCWSDLHAAGLISDDEYSDIARDVSAVDRLEDYDDLRRDCDKWKARAKLDRARLEWILRVGMEYEYTQFRWVVPLWWNSSKPPRVDHATLEEKLAAIDAAREGE